MRGVSSSTVQFQKYVGNGEKKTEEKLGSGIFEIGLFGSLVV